MSTITQQRWPLPRREHRPHVQMSRARGVSGHHRWGSVALIAVLLVALLAGPPGRAAASAPNTWSPTGSMAVARVDQTATLLPGGKVLVAGGQDSQGNPLASAELYSPSTGAWTATGSMTVARSGHTATLLPDGTVLVVGGCCAPGRRGQASAELYNPHTGTWAATGSMTIGRQGHTATLLPNGQVLVSGGGCITQCDAGSFLNTLRSAELYNPQTKTWTATGSMTYQREFHTATLLPNGTVLVAGGFASCDDDSCADDASAELYTPSTGAWTTTGSLPASREQHTATLLPNGQVLVAGGLHDIPVGGGTNELVLADAALYDPTSGTWATTATMTTPRAGQTATLLRNGQVLVAGGKSGSSGTASAELYQPQRGIWVATGTMSTVRTHGTATLLPNGTVLAAGGAASRQVLNSAELYTPGAGPLVYLSPTSLTFPSQLVGTSSSSQNIGVLNAGAGNLVVGSVSVTGNDSGDFTTTTNCTAAPVAPGHTCTVAVTFAPTSIGPLSASVVLADNDPLSPHSVAVSGYGAGPNAWAPTGSLNTGRAQHTATLLSNGQVLVAGGESNTTFSLASAELYDPASGAWTPTGSLNAGRSYATATLLPDGDVLVAGGKGINFASLSSAELYHPASGTWTLTGSMHEARQNHTATLLAGGQVLVAGGSGTASAELYDPAAGTWSLTGAMTQIRSNATATLLPSGKVLVAGGDSSTGATAELYDPGTGTWAATGSMSVGRAGHTATLLPDDTVLVAGGNPPLCCSNPFASAERYDPATGTWSLTGSLNVARVYHTATLLPSGLVLAAGGETCQGGCTTDSTELYDPVTGTWTPASAMTIPRDYHTATLLPSGSVLAAAGSTNACCSDTNSAEIYTPALLAVTPSSGPIGQPIALSGSGFFAHEQIHVFWDSISTPLASATTGATGAFSANAIVPSSSSGAHTIIAVGARSGATARATFEVTP